MNKKIIYNQELFEEALIFAINAHKGQFRKISKLPYILHPIRILNHLLEYKEKSNNVYLLAISVLLHDTVEDCKNVTLPIIAEKFGYKVASIVEDLTSDKYAIKKIGKTEYLKNKLTKISSYALTIKLLDRYDNCLDLNKKDTSLSFKIKYKEETLELLDYLSNHRNLSKTQDNLVYKIEKLLLGREPIYI